MEDKTSVGSKPAQRCLLLDTDVRGRILSQFDWAKHWAATGFVSTSGFEHLLETITKGDKALTDTLLRRWRVQSSAEE